MSDHTDMTTMNAYRQALILALRLKDVPGDRIGEIVAELTTEHRPGPLWVTVSTVTTSGVAGWCIAQGALAVLLDRQYLGWSGWAWLVIGVLIAVPGGFMVRRRSTRVRDPRTGNDMVPSSPWGVIAVVGLPLAIVLLAFGAIRLLG